MEVIRFQTDIKDRLQDFLMLRHDEDEENSRITLWSGTLKMELLSRIKKSAAVVGLAGTSRMRSQVWETFSLEDELPFKRRCRVGSYV